MWVVKNGKWNIIKDTTYINLEFDTHKIKKGLRVSKLRPAYININLDINKLSNKQRKFFYLLSYCGQYNNYGVFVKEYKLNKNKLCLKLLTLKSNENKINSLFP